MTSRAQEEWRRVAPDLIARGVLTPLDVPLFEAYCETWSLRAMALAEIAEHGILVVGQRGTRVKNPAVGIARAFLDDLVRIGAKFGLSPYDRLGLKIADAAPKSGLDRFR